MICHIYTCIDMANFKSSTATTKSWAHHPVAQHWAGTPNSLETWMVFQNDQPLVLAQFDYFHPIFDGAEAKVYSSLASDG